MEMSRVPYASIVRSLIFAMICIKPDITQAVGAVSRYMVNTGGEHWNATKRTLKYIKGTSETTLCYGGSEFTVRGYIDSDFTEVVEDRSVDIKKIHTMENLADALTKPINTDKFQWYRSSYGVADIYVLSLLQSRFPYKTQLGGVLFTPDLVSKLEFTPQAPRFAK
ncbi:hypothetical protein PanWU01x14_013310 [Parasponia andersonii]|uniref:Uncharacterized protein n=1 Tax=Parasponia andersonii TaxID=3476 RepID=A0A2P5E0Z1_PARAD|nr:hypothetical protein PanWU01x14_013310 [Parasponia andersonii]